MTPPHSPAPTEGKLQGNYWCPTLSITVPVVYHPTTADYVMVLDHESYDAAIIIVASTYEVSTWIARGELVHHPLVT